jgi:hypothetical protein
MTASAYLPDRGGRPASRPGAGRDAGAGPLSTMTVTAYATAGGRPSGNVSP